VLEDALVEVGGLCFLADIMTLDMKLDAEVSLLLRRNFQITTKATIDVEQG